MQSTDPTPPHLSCLSESRSRQTVSDMITLADGSTLPRDMHELRKNIQGEVSIVYIVSAFFGLYSVRTLIVSYRLIYGRPITMRTNGLSCAATRGSSAWNSGLSYMRALRGLADILNQRRVRVKDGCPTSCLYRTSWRSAINE